MFTMVFYLVSWKKAIFYIDYVTILDISENKMKNKFPYIEKEVRFPLAKSIADWDDDFHCLMLNDVLRMNFYETMIKSCIHPWMSVVDIGTGTWILALRALEAWAEKVYGIELNYDRIKQAKKRINDAWFSDKFTILHSSSFDVILPRKVDVIISEILGNFWDNESFPKVLNDAKRFLKKTGFFLPANVKNFIVPVAVSECNQQIQFWKIKSINNKYDINKLLKNNWSNSPFDMMYDAIIPQKNHLADFSLVNNFDLSWHDVSFSTSYSKNIVFEVNMSWNFSWFKWWFSASTNSWIVLNISGEDIKKKTCSDCRKHAYFPIENTIYVEEWDKIILNFSCKERSVIFFDPCYKREWFILKKWKKTESFSHYS